MTRVLILTKSILAEQELQCTLQRSIDEVYCSCELLNGAENTSKVIKYFSVVIFSDTISTIEVAKYIPKFKKMGLAIIRKGNKEYLNSSDFSYLGEEIDDWIDGQTIPSMLIEKIAKIDEKNENKFSTNHQLIDPDCKYSENRNQFIVYFTKNQRKLLYYLYIANGTCVSRNDLCQLMWGEKISDSPLSQLSTLVANMREKLVNSGFDERDIKTVWGKGYFLSSEFMDFLTQNKIFTQGQLSKYF